MPGKAVLAVVIAAACGNNTTGPTTPTGEVPTLVLYAARMLDVTKGAYVNDVAIGIRGDKITQVGKRADVRTDASTKVIDLGAAVVMPGMIDAHVHLTLAGTGQQDAGKTLNAGFTTVRDLGSAAGRGVALRDAIERGTIVGPRMIVAGAGIGSPTGACVNAFGTGGSATDAATAGSIIDAQAAAGVNLIKICTGGGVIPTAGDLDTVELDATILKAIAEAARRHNLPIAAHAEGPKAITAAVGAGASSIEHGALIDASNAAAMSSAGTVLVPTLYRIDFTLSQMQPGPARDQVAEGRALAFANVKAAIAAGVKVVLGTDAVVIPHGENARELGALVEVGLTPAAAIRAATLDAAALIGGELGGQIGSIEPGKLADVIAVRGDPLADVAAAHDVVFVVKGGAIVRDEH